MTQQKLDFIQKTKDRINIYQEKPELRFPEFNEEWESIKLSNFLEFIPTNSLSRAKLNLNEGDIKNIHYGDIHTKFPTILDVSVEEIPYINLDEDSSKFKKEQFCKDGDLIIADASEDYADIGKAIELVNVDTKLVAGLHTILARDKLNKTVSGFKGYLFLNENLRKQIKIQANGISVLGISKNNIAKLDVNLPSLEEQEKIVSFLRAVDKKIELLEKKHIFYLDFKKKMVKELTSYNNQDNWQKYKLKELIKEYSEKSTVNNQYPVLSSTKEKIISQLDYFNKNIASSDNTGYKIIHKNQLVLSPQNLWLGNININEEFEIGLVSPSYKIYDITEKVEINYFKHIIKTPKMLYLYKTVSEQGASIVRRNLNKELFENLEIYLPPKSEQIKIGSFLSSIDKKIEYIVLAKDEMDLFKKGLIQKMFV